MCGCPQQHPRIVCILQRPALPGYAPVGRQDPGYRSCPASKDDPGGYANAAAQDEFCANTYCWITILYDQSGKGNHLIQAPRGGFSGPTMGGFNNLPIADMAPITLMGHKVYGIFIEPGMGLRENDPKGTAVDDQAEGQYWVINGHHYNGGCCFDYGNAETDSRDDGDGTMETTYYGNATPGITDRPRPMDHDRPGEQPGGLCQPVSKR